MLDLPSGPVIVWALVAVGLAASFAIRRPPVP
jgi:MYXO-CTERM domain-containing protein